MKIAAITPTRGDRPKFLGQARLLLKLQTHPPDEMIVIDDPPLSDEIDIAWRYKEGCQKAVDRGCSLLLFWEDDDYYAPSYIEAMVKAYSSIRQKPLVFGASTTVYYNILLRKWGMFLHENHASAMNTLMQAEAVQKFPWPGDDKKMYNAAHGTGFFDKQLWEWAKKHKSGKALPYKRSSPLPIRIKHGIGKCGGSRHDTNEAAWLVPLNNDDRNLLWLNEHVVPEAFPFYERLAREVQEP